jgi:Replication initiator protein A
MAKSVELSKRYVTSEGVYGARTARAFALLKGPEGQALTGTRSGALFSLGAAAPNDRSRYSLPTQQRSTLAFFDALFDLAGASADSAVDMRTLQERLGLQRPTILSAVRQLISAGLLLKTDIAYYPGRRSVTLYVLVPSDEVPIPNDSNDAPVHTDSQALTTAAHQLELPMAELLVQKAVQLRYDPILDRNMPWKGERLIVFNLTALLRSGRTGSETQLVRAQIRQGKRYCQAEARAAAGTMVAGVLDLRPLIVLLTLVRQHLKALDGRPAENIFTIGLRDVCEAMAIEPSSSNIRAVFAQLKRWWQTTFMIVDDIYGMFDWAPNAFEVGQGFSVISGLNYVSWVGRDGVTPEILQVRLYQPIYEALLESNRALSVHKEILQDRKPHPLRHKLYYWCRRVIQHQHDPREYLLDHVRAEIQPAKSLNAFRRELREALAEEFIVAEQAYRARLPGYLLWYQPNPKRPKHDVLRAAADPRDPIVGEGSAYAKRYLTEE